MGLQPLANCFVLSSIISLMGCRTMWTDTGPEILIRAYYLEAATCKKSHAFFFSRRVVV